MELGGKDAAIVLEDAPVQRTARGLVWGAFTNAGQNCASIERAYVVRGIATELIVEIRKVIEELVPTRDIGPMTTNAQSDLVVSHITGAIAAGAEVVGGERPSPGVRRIGPIVLRVEDEDCDLMREETFGPVLPIVVVADAEEAVRRANDSRFALTASVWTTRHDRGASIAKTLRAGVVTINNHAFTAAIPSLPWSGLGDSGFGVTNGPHALHAFVRPKLVLIDRNRMKSELWWYPYTPALRAVARAMAKLRGGAGIFGRVSGLIELLTALPKRFFGK
jgi:acyl-CoA reductase-like NAD-dependent aldehyde dehydrogenase